MTLNNLTMHYIQTEQHQSNVTLYASEHVYDSKNPIANKFAQHLTENFYNRSTIQKAKFDNISGTLTPFEQILKRYNDEKEEFSFLDFSKAALEILKAEMEEEPLSVGGIVTIGEIETTNNIDLIFVALLKKTEKFAFDEHALDLREVETLDYENLAVASFINLNIYFDENDERHYISFIRGLRDVAHYFIKFLGVGEDRFDSIKQTDELIRAIKGYVATLGLDEEEKKNLYDRLYSTLFAHAKDKKEISIDTISALIDEENKEGFKRYIQNPESGFEINTTIELLNATRLKKLIHFRFRGNGLSIYFDKDKYLDKIEIDDDKNIIKDAPRKLIEELKNEKQTY